MSDKSTLIINTLSEERYSEISTSTTNNLLYIIDDSDDSNRTVVPSYDLLREKLSLISVDKLFDLSSEHALANSTIVSGFLTVEKYFGNLQSTVLGFGDQLNLIKTKEEYKTKEELTAGMPAENQEINDTAKIVNKDVTIYYTVANIGGLQVWVETSRENAAFIPTANINRYEKIPSNLFSSNLNLTTDISELSSDINVPSSKLLSSIVVLLDSSISEKASSEDLKNKGFELSTYATETSSNALEQSKEYSDSLCVSISSTVNAKFEDYSLIGHTHDDRYYTEDEINEKFLNEITARNQAIEAKGDILFSELSVEVEKITDTTTGYLATYIVKQNGKQAGVKIDIPKDFLVKKAEVKACTEDNEPIEGLIVGDKYIDFTINSKDETEEESHLYIKVKDMVTPYLAGETTSISVSIGSDNTIYATVKNSSIISSYLASDAKDYISEIAQDKASIALNNAFTSSKNYTDGKIEKYLSALNIDNTEDYTIGDLFNEFGKILTSFGGSYKDIEK